MVLLTPTHPVYNVNPDKLFSLQWHFYHCKFSQFLAFYILLRCIFLLHHSRFLARHTRAILSNVTLRTKVMLSTAPGFYLGKRITEHCSILTSEAVGFPKELLPPWVHRISYRNAAISCISTVQTVQIEMYLRKGSCDFILKQHITREHGATNRKLSFSFYWPSCWRKWIEKENE